VIAPVELDLEVYKGTSWDMTLVWSVDSEPFDLTGCTAVMQVRSESGADLVLEASDANGRITLGTTDGLITVDLPYTVTDTVPLGRYKYELRVTSGSQVYAVAYGRYLSLVGIVS
jgi:hypothetical protein